MSAQDQNTEKFIYEIILNYFKSHKVEISDAINRTFPFLETFRDRGLIDNELYEESLKSWKQLSPVQKVVYDVLSILEKKFDLSVLEILFSKVFMKNYPELKGVRQGFRNVIQEQFCHQVLDGERRPNVQLNLEQGTYENLCQILSWLSPDASNYNDVYGGPESGPSGQLCELEQEMETSTASENSNAQAVMGSDDSTESSGGNEPPEASTLTSALKRGPGTMNPENNSPLEKVKKKRTPRKLPDGTMDFHAEVLPVTCGEVKGMLYKHRFKQGATTESIRTEDGTWCTPREFEIKGGHEKSSYWKHSVRCGGRPLRWLIEHELLPQPAATHGRKKQVRNSTICMVCQGKEKLFFCDICAKSFHEECHLPPVETERSPWSCTFCRMEECSESPPCPPCHREPEVLARQMGPDEQLKCELLLLSIYCSVGKKESEKSLPANNGPETDIAKIDDIKKRLRERGYPDVGGFVQDVRLILQSHRDSSKCTPLCLMRVNLGVEFEKKFKEVFAILKTEKEK